MNVLTKNVENRNQIEFVSLEEMVPADHLLRQIDAEPTSTRFMNL